MAIPRTYFDGNPEDRRTATDFWSWLKTQPQAAWLNYARAANWDNADLIFVDMIGEADCDRALASWLFWRSNPAFLIAHGKRPPASDVTGAILDRIDRGGFAVSRLHYLRTEVVTEAQGYVAALRGLSGPAPFSLPRELCASFDGANPDLPAYDEQTERDLAEVFHSIDGQLWRSDAEFHAADGAAGNRWYEAATQLPAPPASLEGLADDAAIEAVFGNHDRFVAAKSRVQRVKSVRAPGGGRRPWGVGRWLIIFSVLMIGGALLAHRIRTGTW